jgi:hypothetical protein
MSRGIEKKDHFQGSLVGVFPKTCENRTIFLEIISNWGGNKPCVSFADGEVYLTFPVPIPVPYGSLVLVALVWRD